MASARTINVADWDPGGVLELGSPVHGSLGQAGSSCSLIRMRDVALEEGRCYRITLGASGVDARVALFENPAAGAYWASDAEALVDLAAGQTPYIFTADRTDVYGVAVYDDNVGAANGDYTLEVVGLDAGCTTHVALARFAAAPGAESTALRWRTGVETDHLGFRLLRATAAAAGPGGAAGDGAEGTAGASHADFEPIGPQLIRAAGGSQATAHAYTYVDDDPALEPGVTYRYLLEAIDLQGGVQSFGPLSASLAPLAASPGMTRLAAAQPNPFFDRTQLHYQLQAPGQVELVIYDVRGRVVRALEHAYRPAGQYDVTWDGRSDQGAALPSGIYFGRLLAGNTADRVKLLLVR